ncbi:hypothetical protein C9I86_14315 [Photobacterium sp. NCIMB 13483]|uniref:hypothetical protein n=1 Tax=Photobacterium sp. NCIMB 13483 TaxID=2022103 RepID=UPI000D156C52|nr:hypothetical protein [Photobacterium sp. NCIMB 13483]PST86665.1 hypothetical protein C9I86_14315 [Photobacterium sp. NCIMB 13483]
MVTCSRCGECDCECGCFEDYEHYKEYRDFLIDGEMKVSEGLDKAVLTISSAALGLTFAFSQSVLKSGVISGIEWLKASWLFFGLSVTLVLASLLMSGFIYLSNRKMCDSVMSNRVQIIESLRSDSHNCPEKVGFTDSKLRCLNQALHFIGPFFLVLGILCVGSFFNLNIGELSNGKETCAEPQSITIKTKDSQPEDSIAAAAASAKNITSKDVVNVK